MVDRADPRQPRDRRHPAPDTFAGFASYWKIPASATAPSKGNGALGQGKSVPRGACGAGRRSLIAEDLGMITDDVRALLPSWAFPA